MADPKEDNIDFQKLEKELSLAVEANAKYWRENDAKFRAVEQRVETYEQFRDIVAASHLKPLKKGDKEGLGRLRQQPWNPYGSKKEKNLVNDVESSKNEITISKDLPKDGHQFLQQWKKLGENQQQKYKYLLQFNANQLYTIFRNEISFGLLGEILKLFNLHYKETNFKDVVSILRELSNTKRFGLTIDFLSKEEATDRDELMDKLQKTLNCDLNIESDFDLVSLRKLYGSKSDTELI